MSNFEIGQTFRGNAVEDVPTGAVVVDVKGAPHVRHDSGWVFTDHSAVLGTFTLVWLPPEEEEDKGPDLTDRETLTFLMYQTMFPNTSMDKEEVSEVGIGWKRVADFVLENFVPKNGIPAGKDLQPGDLVRIVRDDPWRSWVSAWKGQVATVVYSLDVDDEYLLLMEDGDENYVHYTALDLA